MKNYKVIWYKGHITEEPSKDDFIEAVLDEKTVKANSITEVRYINVLSNNEKNKYGHGLGGHGYARCILCDGNNIICDYGSYDKFIWIKGEDDE